MTLVEVVLAVGEFVEDLMNLKSGHFAMKSVVDENLTVTKFYGFAVYSSIYLSLKVMNHSFRNLIFSFYLLFRAKYVVVRLTNILTNTNIL